MKKDGYNDIHEFTIDLAETIYLSGDSVAVKLPKTGTVPEDIQFFDIHPECRRAALRQAHAVIRFLQKTGVNVLKFDPPH